MCHRPFSFHSPWIHEWTGSALFLGGFVPVFWIIACRILHIRFILNSWNGTFSMITNLIFNTVYNIQSHGRASHVIILAVFIIIIIIITLWCSKHILGICHHPQGIYLASELLMERPQRNARHILEIEKQCSLESFSRHNCTDFQVTSWGTISIPWCVACWNYVQIT